ncbi:universal stress protein [Neolewinella persica]|uniref:universal stress protein n=1 Tax=Neolewinella persica TaxID=70998 RepID=UPI000366AAD7|nr:universal stress protein [Neolewinella persica]
MPNILIPVDFSLPCHNAYRYGLHLAQDMGCNVVLVHYYSSSIDPNQPLVFSGDGSIYDSYIQRMRQFAYPSGDGIGYHLVEPPRGVEIFYECALTFNTPNAIIERAEESDIVAVVMAPRSKAKLMDKWLGSTSTTVSEACNRPVYLVPPEVNFSPFERIVVANNHLAAQSFPLWQIEQLAEKYRATVHFVHVEWPNQYGPLKFVPWRLMEKLTASKSGNNYPFKVVTVNETDITKGLLEYADKEKANLVVIVNKLHGHWRAFLRASLTQNLALRSNKPILVLHGGEDEVAKDAMDLYADKKPT